MKQVLVGRKAEEAELDRVRHSGKLEFVAAYGRRRIGKTFLIRETFGNQFDFYMSGTANASLHEQLFNFHTAIGKCLTHDQMPKQPENWQVAFQQLEQLIANSKRKRKVIFMDELPWLDTPQSGFLCALEYFWNTFASTCKDIVLIVCGSAASWIINTLIHHRGGLYHRVTMRISLAPFYLDMVDTRLSAAQNINKLCFQPNGFLVDEFRDLYLYLYLSLFNKAARHQLIVEALGKKNKGLTRGELLDATGLPNAGSTTRLLKELEESGFIKKYNPFGKKQRNALYQLVDFYSLFYIRFIKDHRFTDDGGWAVGLDHPKQRAWSGYAFEQVCLAHVRQIKQALGIAGIQTQASSWANIDGAGPKTRLDLVIDRRDGVINLCEMKFSLKPFAVTKKYLEELTTKIDTFPEVTGTNKSLHLTMITTFGLVQNPYAQSIVQHNLAMDDLFV